MINSKYIDKIIAVFVIVSLAFTIGFMRTSSSTEAAIVTLEPEYATKLFDKEGVIEVSIKADQSQWDDMIKNANKEEYIPCDVTINGTTFNSVGIRPKGNSSLNTIYSDPNTDRYSFKLEFDHYIKGQTCFGLDKLALNNIQADTTYMKEYLSYDLLDYMGVVSPLYSFTNIMVNDETWGFYIAVECVEESFAERNYGSNYGMLYKPESMGMNAKKKENNGENDKNKDNNGPPDMNGKGNNGGNIGPGMKGDMPQGENAPNIPQGGNGGNMPPEINGENFGENKMPLFNGNDMPNEKVSNYNNDRENEDKKNMMNIGMGRNGNSAGCDLKYVDDNIDNYSNIFNSSVFKVTDEDYERVITALKNLSEGKDLEKYIDVDQVLRYFAVNTALVNLDSYVTNMQHNYYLYENDGQLSMVPWDYNLSFAGFQPGNATSAVNFAIDTPVSGVEMSERPMLSKLLEVDEYKEKYHEYLSEIASNYFGNGIFKNKINKLNSIIGEYVKNDPSAFYTYDEYTKSLGTLKEFGRLRALSIQGQLEGTIPSTTTEQKEDSSKLIDASSINLSTMGMQGGGGEKGNRQDKKQELNLP
ncbi:MULTISPECIES: CotH kinase family protein [Clostridium]|uniref:CotH kinase family protein n=1 Tax=Clostridium TaxID=1485 RepID=UPI0004226606|nr:CotH kinase family protein [Clostridium cadaveris]MDU4952663.1 CotH kinase family protein [Clostridium sp.]